MAEVARALTGEEWEAADYRQRPRVLDEWAKGRPTSGPQDDPNEYVAKLGLDGHGCVIAMNRAHDQVLVPPPARAALAAFALQDQPFGFVHEDVAALRRTLEGAGTSADLDRNVLRGLAARIEALLPPERSPGG